jgi:hypothetical protein
MTFIREPPGSGGDVGVACVQHWGASTRRIWLRDVEFSPDDLLLGSIFFFQHDTLLFFSYGS